MYPDFAEEWESIMPMNQAISRPLPSRTHNRAGSPPERWKAIFLATLADTQLITESLKAANVSRSTAYRMRAEDEEFRESWEEILERGLDILEAVAMKRAANGSDNLMMFILKARRADVYGDRMEVHSNQTVQGTVTLVDGRNPVEYDSSARRKAAALLVAGRQDQNKSDDEVVDAEVIDE